MLNQEGCGRLQEADEKIAHTISHLLMMMSQEACHPEESEWLSDPSPGSDFYCPDATWL
jgi:hypothetical protein